MSTEADLLAAIRAHPEEDTPRLAYADWLDEQGGEDHRAWAEFIRLQCESARLDPDDPDPAVTARLKAIQPRIAELEKKYKMVWGAAMKGRTGPLRGRDGVFHFRRGFPERAFAPADRLIAEGGALFELAPVTELDVRSVTSENLDRLLACPWLAKVRSLTLSGPYEPAAPSPDWECLADCPYLGNLTWVWLGHGQLSPRGAARLAAANPFPGLREFHMSDTPVGDAGVEGLFAGPAFGRLEEVYFHDCDVGTDGVKAIARAPGLTGLAKLSLPSHPLTADAVRGLTAGRLWPELRELVLWGCGLNDSAVAALAAAPGPSRLRALDLSINRFGPAGVAALAKSRLLETLECLNLSSNRLWDEGARALLRSPHLRGLRRLDLGSSGIGPEGATALADCPALAGLRRLALYSNPVQAAGALAIADSPYLAGLTDLSLSNIRGKARQRLVDRFGDRVRF